ncbi:MAG: glycoside hydrolase family 43 protein [Bacteroidetes bacterium]|nr:MAG: glycoside hydrolase family 43 protein [Bacteroidota bacterium]
MMKKFFLFFLFSVLLLGTKAQTFNNPILAGFYSDPSICRVSNDYYITTSTFAYFPGLPIFHSTDLVNWKQIGNAMDRQEQLDQTNAGVSRGLFAPTIRYNKGTFYILCTLIDKKGNFIITAKDPKGPWSNPIWLPEVRGIDPSIDFVDDRAYVVYNNDAPDNKPLYNGHRTIRMYEFDINTMKVVGQEKLLVNGGTDLSKKPIWIEAPHIFKKDAWYYLICAEGGTGYNHSEVVFRSKAVDGPYIPYEKNPILTQRHLDKQRQNPVTTTGHADFVETPDGKWFAVFLACRPYGDDIYNTGRETFLLPVEWKDGWPHILEGNEEVPYTLPVPLPALTKKVNNPFGGNVTFKDDFNNKKFEDRYLFLRNPEMDAYSLTAKSGFFQLSLRPQTASERKSPSFLGSRQHNLKGYAATSIDFTAASEKEKAGLMIFQSENNYYFLCKSIENGKPVVQLYKSPSRGNKNGELLASQPLTSAKSLYLKIESNAATYAFYFADKKNKWKLLKDGVDASFLSTKKAGGFVGSLFALYGTSDGEPTTSVATYDWFEYKGNDDGIKK